MNKFKQLKHFTERENWGDPDKMDHALLLKLDAYRHKVGHSFSINCGYELTGHSDKSQHSLGLAIDGRFNISKVSLFEAYLMAERFDFKGIGLYPKKGNWFIHLDERKLLNNYRARWIRDDVGNYHSLTAETLKEFVLSIS